MNRYSASYDVDLAKKYGLEAAALFNKLVFLSRYSNREDGYCWKTAKELEDELGITKRQQERAIKILENAGLIKTKVTYISGTLSRCKHFKVFTVEDDKNAEIALSESNKMSLSIESNKMSLSEDNKTSLSNNSNHTIVSNNNNINIFESEFTDVWKLYPRKLGKDNACKAYIKARKDGETKEDIIEGINRYVEQIRVDKTEERFIKHGSTWFNQRCWHDTYKREPTELEALNEGRADDLKILKVVEIENGGYIRYYADGYAREFDRYHMMQTEYKYNREEIEK